jgi:hypothetical protein
VSRVDSLIRDIERIGHEALKAEWNRVKRGERPFYIPKYFSLAIFSIALIVLAIYVGRNLISA